MEQQSIGLLNGRGISSRTLKEQAYQLIKDGILYHKLQVGMVYSQDAICNDLGLSRTPVREALLQLEQEGYIAFLRGRGVEVLPLTDERAAEIMEARFYLEQIGSRLAAFRRTEEHLRRLDAVMTEMTELCTSGDSKLMYRLDREFHTIIFEASGNSLMLGEIETLRDHFLRFETFSAFDREDYAREVIEEHGQILAALREGSADKAVAAMRHHLRRTSLRTTSHLLSHFENETLGL